MTTLPRPYQLLASLACHVECGDCLDTIQELVLELWQAGQTEKRAMDTYEYDPPLWCGGLHPDEVTRTVGVPTVAASDPAKDYGRGRTIR